MLTLIKRYVASQLDNMNSEAQTYYTKLHTEFNKQVKNTLTLYYNDFTRDWYKLDKVNGVEYESNSIKSIRRLLEQVT